MKCLLILLVVIGIILFVLMVSYMCRTDKNKLMLHTDDDVVKVISSSYIYDPHSHFSWSILVDSDRKDPVNAVYAMCRDDTIFHSDSFKHRTSNQRKSSSSGDKFNLNDDVIHVHGTVELHDLLEDTKDRLVSNKCSLFVETVHNTYSTTLKC